jgi:hypothetical protein
MLLIVNSQLWANYKRKSGESLSILFLVIWLIGDFFSIAGLVLLELELYQIILAVYYTIVDALLIWQSMLGWFLTISMIIIIIFEF